MKEKEYLESIIPKELKDEYTEASAAFNKDGDESLSMSDTIKSKVKDVLGSTLGWQIRIINQNGEVIETVKYTSDAMYKLKPGALLITDEDAKKLKEGKIIHPHQVVSVDKRTNTITASINNMSSMGMLNKSGNLGPDEE